MRFSTIFVAFSAIVPFATASNLKDSCESTEFWWQDKQCCLPNGGVTNPPLPPKGVSCPPSSHYWSLVKNCCVPRYPPGDNQPQPQCSKGYDWYNALYQCLPQPGSHSTTHKPSATPTTSTPPTPTYGNGDGYGYGNGYGNGDGYGSGIGYGNGNGYGNGYGHRRRRALELANRF